MHSVAPPPKDPLTEPGPWNAIAAGYDEVCFELMPPLSDAAIELLRPESGDRVLDIAAGPGTFAVRLAPRVGHVVAIDFAEVMIERLRGHIMRSRLANLEAKLMNGEDLAFDDSSFDAAVSLFGVVLFDNRQRALEEMLRVVVPGGKALFSTWAAPDENTWLSVAEEALRVALPELPTQEGDGAPDPEQCQSELEAVGFEQVATVPFKKALRFASVADYWRAFERTSPALVLLQNRLGGEAYAAASERARAALLATCGDSAFELNCCAVLTIGERPLSAA